MVFVADLGKLSFLKKLFIKTKKNSYVREARNNKINAKEAEKDEKKYDSNSFSEANDKFLLDFEYKLYESILKKNNKI